MARFEEWTPLSWHCPNCGKLVTGCRNAGSHIKVECIKCHVVMVRRIIGRRHDTLDIYAPEGQEHII